MHLLDDLTNLYVMYKSSSIWNELDFFYGSFQIFNSILIPFKIS